MDVNMNSAKDRELRKVLKQLMDEYCLDDILYNLAFICEDKSNKCADAGDAKSWWKNYKAIDKACTFTVPIK